MACFTSQIFWNNCTWEAQSTTLTRLPRNKIIISELKIHGGIYLLFILIVKPRILYNNIKIKYKVNLIAILAKNPMERRQGRKFKCSMWEENPRELFQGNPQTKDPIHIILWKARKDITTPTWHKNTPGIISSHY